MTEKGPLPRKCLDSCEVPYLCVMACPLNSRLDQLAFAPVQDAPIELDNPLAIVIADKDQSETGED